MARSLDLVGAEWLVEQVEALTDHITHLKPSAFNEQHRYLPESVTSMPGFLRYDVNPYMREIVDCFDVASPVREVNVKKGAQITFTTAMESGLLYFMAHIKTLPMAFITADKELATMRVENNVVPMLQQSGFSHIIQSNDESSARKTGKTKDLIQFEGGGYLMPMGALSPAKMRSASLAVQFKDELDGWPNKVGKDGCPDKLTDARSKGYWSTRKIMRGSTPLIKGTSKIERQYLRGDQRKYMVLCKKCGYPQELRWSTKDEIGGFKWDMDDGVLILSSVRYCCQQCGEPHYERDKERLFSEKSGAHWKPTARPVEPGIRSYHLPGLYSPFGMLPWYQCVLDYLDAFDIENRRVKDVGKYQEFYNNVLGEPFEIMGSKIQFTSVSLHRRHVYKYGQIPNKYAIQFSGSPILFLTCQVDVHQAFLAVAVTGWCRDAKTYVIDYLRVENKGEGPAYDFRDPSCKGWGELRKIIEESEYVADDGKKYRIVLTLIDSGYANDTVAGFCADYSAGVYPIVGRKRPAKAQTIKEFAQFETQIGTVGYRIIVDHYKDRIAPILRRDWVEESGVQSAYHFNAPTDMTDAQIKELTVETRREEIDAYGETNYTWYRPGNARNELWDCLVYGHAAVEILAWTICIGQFDLNTIDWPQFWDYLEGENKLYVDSDDTK